MEEKIKAIEEEVEADKQKSTLRDLSQQELEDKMSATRDELEAAKTAKEFAKCIDLQVLLSPETSPRSTAWLVILDSASETGGWGRITRL